MNKSNKIWDILKKQIMNRAGKVKKETLLVLFLTGILLLVIALPISGEQQNKDNTKSTYVEETSKEEVLDAYQEKMEKQLKKILQKVEGLGTVDVMITVEDAGEVIIEKDDTTSISNENKGYQEETVYSEDEYGQQPYVVNTMTPRIKGILIVATNGNNPELKAEVLEAVMALFQLESHKISIIKGN